MARDTSAKPPETYISLWTLTDAGRQDPARVRDTIERASAMIKAASGSCMLHVCVGGPYDLIGIATGVDEPTILQIQQAIQSLGTLRTTFVKTREHSLSEYRAFLAGVTNYQNVKLA
jgi:uncharacterized protein with GYD domain